MADHTYDDTEDKRLTLEAATNNLSDSLFRAWEACRFTYRTYTYINKVFVIWEVIDAEPVVIGSVRILEPSISRYSGFSLKCLVTVGLSQREAIITHTPTAVYLDKVFISIPFNVTAKFVPKNDMGVHNLFIPAVIKHAAKPWDPVYGVRLTQQSEFKATYPQFKELML